MTVFVSYARQDRDIVAALCNDLELLGREVWIDERLRGGQEWWDQILDHIRSCDVFVWTVSPASVASKACRSELEYASALGRAVLPVKVKDVSLALAPQRIANAQVVDYTERDANQALRLAGDLQALAAAGPLPELLPAPPPVPITYLDMFADEVGSMTPMSPERQREVVSYLRAIVSEPGNTEDIDAARGLLQRLRARNEITFESATAIDALLVESLRAPRSARRSAPGRLDASRSAAATATPGRVGTPTVIGRGTFCRERNAGNARVLVACVRRVCCCSASCSGSSVCSSVRSTSSGARAGAKGSRCSRWARCRYSSGSA